MRIEMFIAYTDHTWDTMVISIENPSGRDLSISEWEKKVEELGRSKILLKHQGEKEIALSIFSAVTGIYFSIPSH